MTQQPALVAWVQGAQPDVADRPQLMRETKAKEKLNLFAIGMPGWLRGVSASLRASLMNK